MTDETTDRTEIIPGPAPTAAFPGPGATPRPGGPWVAGPPPPPGRDPAIPVRDAPPGPGPRLATPPGAGRTAFDLRRLSREPVGVLGGAAILVAYAAAWVASLLAAVRHAPGISAQQRLLDLLGPGSVGWGVFLLVTLGLIGPTGRGLRGPERSRLHRAVARGLLVASAAAAAAAALATLVELANFGHGIDAAFAGLVSRLAALAVAGAATWWAWSARAEPPG